MKRVFAFVFLLIFSGMVVAANQSSPMDLNEAGRQISEQGNTIFSSQVKIPEGLQSLAKFFFGFDSGTTLDIFIFTIIMYIAIFTVIIYIMPLVPFFNGSKVTVLVSSIVVTLLIGISGGLKESAFFFLSLGGLLDFLDRWPFIKFGIVNLIIVLIVLSSTRLFKIIRRKMDVEIAKQVGKDLAEGSGFAKIFASSGRKLAE